MNLRNQKKIASRILKCSPKKVEFDPESHDQLKESITRVDLRGLVVKGIIRKKQVPGQSRGRAVKIALQKSRGKRKGQGSRKGKSGARENTKTTWINHIRKQRKFIKLLKEKEAISNEEYRILYKRSKGGYFRSVRHIKIFINDVIRKNKLET